MKHHDPSMSTTTAPPPLFAQPREDPRPRPSIRGMVRRGDHDTSKAAARDVAQGLSGLQRQVLGAFDRNGDMTDGTLENLAEFRDGFSPSTVRKRRVELYQKGLLDRTDKREPNPYGRGTMIVWALSAAGRKAIGGPANG